MNPRDADRVVILDRDGTLVFDRHYLSDPAGLEFLPGAAEALRSMYASGYRLVVITNQSGIGRGLFSLTAMQQMNERLMQMVAEAGAHLERIYVCPHRPEDHCDCRKPKPKLLLDAAAELGFAVERSVVIGDKQSDVEFGAAVGATTMLVSERGTAGMTGAETQADLVVRDLSEAATALQGEVLTMYLVTGGAGFIGSHLVAELAARGESVVVCDWLRSDERWRNLSKHELTDLVSPEALPEWLDARPRRLKAVLHMGAVSTTTETDVDLIARLNIRATLDLLEWCRQSGTPFIYASSAATYGDGSAGFDDEFTVDALARLKPLNAYGWSKHVIDRRVARLIAEGAAIPPQCVGLKFFNVYGPNEYHKGTMQSVVARNFESVRGGAPMQLFRSYRSDYADGGQLRDFIYVRDCVAVILWLIEHPAVSGLFNVGTGKARSWLDLASALLRACGREPQVEFIDMPAALIDKYQYFTEARMQRLRAAGFVLPFTSLEEGVTDYVQRYLASADRYR